MQGEKRFAVLIDADNISAKYIKYILEEISNYGIATYKRIYGDWTKPNSGSWKDVLLENSVTPIQQYSYTFGKNATDSAMIIDAMDILYSGNVEGFCIVSSDSDFTKLSSRLRESGMMVLGMGEKKTPKPFIAACNQFKYLDVIADTEKLSIEVNSTAEDIKDKRENETSKSVERHIHGNDKAAVGNTQDNGDVVKYMTSIDEIENTIIKMLDEIDSDEQGMTMGELGNRLVKRYPDFDVRNYGYTKLTNFLKKFDAFDIKAKGRDGTAMWVYLKKEFSQPTVEHKPKTQKKKNYNKKGTKKVYSKGNQKKR
ncbi:MAG: NYN domain-containing protein [Clostridiales bacterium]|nr:NYN domain-containing protein [Clostridiales bacterium]